MPTKFVKAYPTKAEIKHGEAGAYLRIHFTSEFTEEVLASMGWTDPGESSKKTRMVGEIMEGNMVLTPDAEMFAKQEIQLSFLSAQDFDLITKTKDESTRRELRFVVDSTAEEAAPLVRGYMNLLKKSTGTLKLGYSSQDELGL